MATRLYTSDDLLRMPEDECQYELERGELVPLSPTGFAHGRLVGKLTYEFEAWIRTYHLPYVTAVDVFVRFEPAPLETVKGPDLVVIRKEALGKQVPMGVLDPTSELIVEVISPDDDRAYLAHTVDLYLKHGVKAVWVVDPPAQAVTVHELEGITKTMVTRSFTKGGQTHLLAPVAGWSLSVDELFSDT